MPNNMRTRGQDIDTDFGELKQAGFELPIARMQKTSIEKAATIFDKYDVRVTIESKAGHTNESYIEVLSAMKDAGLLYREDRRYTIKPDRDCIDILIEKEDMPVIAELNKALGDSGFKFIVTENLPEYIQSRTIVTPEDELDKTKEVKKAEASKKTASNEWVSKDGLIKIYETSHDFQIEHVPSGESQGMGDGVDMFSNEDGESLEIGSPEFDKAMEGFVNSPDLIEAYFPDKLEDDIVEGSKKTASLTVVSKLWVGVRHDAPYEVFTADEEPTEDSHGDVYDAVIGPFRTRRGAEFMALYGRNNPHTQTVDDAERLAVAEAKKQRPAISEAQSAKAAYDQANDGLNLMDTLGDLTK